MPQPLPQPFELTPGPVLNAMRMGQADRLAEEQRGVLKQAGQLAAQGSLAGARKHLLGQGMLEEADKIGAMMRQADGDSLAKAKRTYDVLGNLAMTADTPEKWQMALQAATKAGMDVSKYGDFGARDLVLAQSGKVGEHIENEMKRRALSIKEGKAPQVTEGAAKAANFATMMSTAEGELNKNAPKGPDGQPVNQGIPKGFWGWVREGVVPDGMVNKMRPKEYQEYRQAADQWIRAKLRKESGATISPEESEGEFRTFFPQTGDGQPVIDQKKRARELATQGMIAESRGAYSPQQTGPVTATAPEQPQDDLSGMSDDDLLRSLGL